MVNRDMPDRLAACLGRGEIIAARMRYHEEEESRSKGPLANVRNPLKFRPILAEKRYES